MRTMRRHGGGAAGPGKILEQPGLVRVVHRPASEPGKGAVAGGGGRGGADQGACQRRRWKYPPTLYVPGSPDAEAVLRGLPGG